MRLRSIGVLLLGLILASFSAANAQERFGGLTGKVTDPSDAPVPGVTVTATNKSSGIVHTTVSGTDGVYRILDLEPGRYSVVAELSGFQKAEDQNVLILLGRNIEFSPKLQVGAVTEVVNVTGATPQIDPKSTTVAHNVTAEEFDRLPKARSFQNLALTAPSVNSGEIEGGFQVNGASGAENSFTVDGVTTTSLINGKSRQDTVFEYLQEVQVKTAGIEAEYGGALGGVISAVTKSGGNTLHGEGHYFIDGSPLSAGPVKRLVLSPADDLTVSYVQDVKQKNDRNEVGGSVGGPIVKDKLFFFGSVSPRFVRRTNNYGYSSNTEQGSTDQSQTLNQLFGKLTYSSSRVQVNGSTLLTPTTVDGTLLAYNGTVPNSTSVSSAGNAPNLTRGFKQSQRTFSGEVNFFLTSAAYLSARGTNFYDNYEDTGIPTTTSWTYQTPGTGVAGLPVSLQLPVGATNTPRAQISNFDTTKRSTFDLTYNHSFNGAGSHRLKGGYGFQHVVNDVDSAYPGGFVYLYWGRSFTSSVAGVGTGTGTYGYYEVDNRGTVGKAGADIHSLFVQDSWTATSKLTLNLGIRTEREAIPSFRTGIDAFDFSFKNKLAPRLGATYDVRSDGKLKLFGSWGRYYDWTKYDLPRGSYGGDIWQIYYRSLDTLDINSLNLSNKPGKDLWNPSVANSFRDRRVPNFDSTDPKILPMYQDSTSVGTEYQFSSTSTMGVHYIHNSLGRTIEDLGGLVNGDEVYVIGNPGGGELGTITPSSGLTKPFATPKAVRKYDAFELTYSRRFANRWFGSASYTYSRLFGNYAGLANSDEITTPTTGVSSATTQQQSGSVSRQGGNANRAWDIDEVLFTSHGATSADGTCEAVAGAACVTNGVLGRLATDRPNVVKLYGSYTFPFGTQVGANFYGANGTPMSTYVVTLNQTNLFVEGRGDMGRTPMLTRTDLLVSHELNLMGSQKLRLELNVQNVFNQKTATHIFNYLNRGAGAARPSSAINLASTDLTKGFDYNALIKASPDGLNAYDPRYNKADLFQTGTQGQFSIKYMF
jgi:Carboxypeptidase regulatory-like domain/TonB-dependent Receptor Plug Domain